MVRALSNLLPLLETIISYIDDGVIIFGKTDEIFYLNPSAQKLLDLPPHEKIQAFSQITSVNMTAIIDSHFTSMPQDLPNLPGTGTSTIPAPPLPSVEIRLSLEKGYRDLEFQCCATCEMDTDTGKQFYLLIIKDITQKKKLDSYLKAAAEDLVTNDPEMMALLQKIQRIASSNATVLLQGESGTGKTHIARLVHQISPRAEMPLVTLNCAAIPEQLLESELFGHVAGVYGTTKQRQGRFRSADRGTLLLDEIGEIPLHLQAKLLRAIQDQEFEPVGSDQTASVDVRILASSNQNLLDMVNNGTFRADLYYRLAVIPLHIPPLRDRPGDIPLLIRHFCNDLMSRGYSNTLMECGAETMRLMMNYSWPGNVRELENAVEHAIICSQGDTVEPESLPGEILDQDKGLHKESMDRFQKGHENILRNEIVMALEKAGGNKTKAARELGVDRSTLWRRMRKLHIDA